MPSISFWLALESLQHSLVAFCISLQQYWPLAMDHVWGWASAPGCLCKSVPSLWQQRNMVQIPAWSIPPLFWIFSGFLMPGGNNPTKKCSAGADCEQPTLPRGNVQSQGRLSATAASATIHQPWESQSAAQHGKWSFLNSEQNKVIPISNIGSAQWSQLSGKLPSTLSSLFYLVSGNSIFSRQIHDLLGTASHPQALCLPVSPIPPKPKA